MDNVMREFLTFLGVIAAVIVVTVALAVGGTAIAGRVGCDARWPGKQPHYSLTSGCTIVISGQRIPERAYRVL